MRDFLRYVRLSARLMARNDAWFLLLPVLVLGGTAAATIGFRTKWQPSTGVGQAELLGPLVAAFLCAGLLDPEHRRGAAEIVFSKPHRPAILLGVRFGLALSLTLAMLLAVLTAYQLHFGNAMVLTALGWAVPPCLFVGMLAVSAGQLFRSPLAGLAVALFLWLWNSAGSIVYNWLFALPAGAFVLSTPPGGAPPLDLGINKAALSLASAALFVWNVRRLQGPGAFESSGGGARSRLRWLGIGALFLVAYLWTGALARLWLLATAPPARYAALPALHARPRRGESLAAANRGFLMLRDLYGPLPVPALFGPGTAHFLRGLGDRLDPSRDDYDARRRAALEETLRTPRLNPWRDRARLELAMLDALPPSRFFPRQGGVIPSGWRARPETPEPVWATVCLIDPDRWWVVRQPAGTDPARAERFCSAILDGPAAPGVAAEALALRAALAGDRWDFRAEAADLCELADSFPGSPFAAAAVGQVGQGLAAAERLPEAVATYRHVMRQQPATVRAQLAVGLAFLQAEGGDPDTGRATLRAALQEAEKLPPEQDPQPVFQASPEWQIRQALKTLDGWKSGAPMRPSPPAAPRFPVRARLTAAGRPLAGVAVALAPLPLVLQCLPPAMAAEAAFARPAGARASGEAISRAGPFGRRRGPLEWQTEPLVAGLRRQPGLVTLSDAQGELRWPAVPAGIYGVVLRVGTWQLPGGGLELAPAPREQPAVVAGPETVLPEIRLVPALRPTPVMERSQPPSVRWEAVPGAVRYRVALRAAGPEPPPFGPVSEEGGGAPAIDPSLVWWRDGVAARALTLTPEYFVGPAGDRWRNGLHGGTRYSWSIEAMDAAGRILTTSETLAGTSAFRATEWTALQAAAPADPATRARADPPRRHALMPIDLGLIASDRGRFNSPFLDSLLLTESRPSPRQLPGRQWPRAGAESRLDPQGPARRPLRFAVPSIVADGQGLPPRAPLVALAPAPDTGHSQDQGAAALFPRPLPHAPPGLPARLPAGTMPGGGMVDGRWLMADGGRQRFPHQPSTIPRPGIETPSAVLPEPPAGLARPLGDSHARIGLSPSAQVALAGSKGKISVRENVPPPPARPAASQRPAPAPNVTVSLETFESGSLGRWSVEPAATGEETDSGLCVRGKALLTPRDVSLVLPPRTRRVLAHLVGEASAAVVLKDAKGREERLPLQPSGSRDGWLEAAVPAGAWSLAGIEIAPSAEEEVQLRELAASAAAGPGLFVTAREESDASGAALRVEIVNLGPAAERAVLEAPGAAPSAAIDLAPGGRAVLRLPGLAREKVSIRWRGGVVPMAGQASQ